MRRIFPSLHKSASPAPGRGWLTGSKLLRRSLLLFALFLMSGLGVLTLQVACEPLPAALQAEAPAPSLRLLDRHGHLLRELTREGQRVGAVRLDQVSPSVLAALLAAEDARFYSHPGFDPLAIVRAVGQAITHGRIVSGASTLTQQLARTVVPRPRSFRGKWQELVLALRIERELSKDQILEAYLRFVEFGPRIQGLEAASWAYLNKPASQLDLAEAALLVGLPRGPSLYNPLRHLDRALLRRNRILERMRSSQVISGEEYERAVQQPVRISSPTWQGGADHLATAFALGKLTPELPPGSLREVTTTLDGRLQAEVEALTRTTLAKLQAQAVSSAAVLVIDNTTRDVLAYVGSPDFWSEEHLGQNDGTRALRQPGSTLKPFVYAAAMEELGYTAASLLPDVELKLPTAQGVYSPRNYNGQYHGPVRLRQALASSLNVPAVYAAQQVSPERVLRLLHRFGFDSLDRSASEYGAAIALGDGEVTLAELSAAYATLAREGQYLPLRYFSRARAHTGEEVAPVSPKPRVALQPALSRLLIDLLADREERYAGFGANNVLEFDFPVAAKTGTSKAYRDNWTVGFSSAVTVGVWVGNFDGSPMLQSSGITGAGPLFHDVMQVAMRIHEAQDFSTESLIEVEICPLSGQRVHADCPHRTRERFLPGTVPPSQCSMHERVPIVPSSGLRAGPGCSQVETRVFEIYPDHYQAWARRAGRPLPPLSFDPRCPGESPLAQAGLRVVFPRAGARFQMDPALARSQQSLLFRAEAPTTGPLWFNLNGERLAASNEQQYLWPLTEGHYTLFVETPQAQSEAIQFSVEF